MYFYIDRNIFYFLVFKLIFPIFKYKIEYYKNYNRLEYFIGD